MCIFFQPFSLSCLLYDSTVGTALSSVCVQKLVQCEIVFDYLLDNCKQSDVKTILVEKKLKNIILGK